MESPNDGIPSVVEAAVDWMVVCAHFTASIRYCLLFPSLHFHSFIFLKCARLCMSLSYVLPCERLPSGIEPALSMRSSSSKAMQELWGLCTMQLAPPRPAPALARTPASSFTSPSDLVWPSVDGSWHLTLTCMRTCQRWWPDGYFPRHMQQHNRLGDIRRGKARGAHRLDQWVW